jgi:uncharacterized protein (DUF1684 family)
MKTLVVLLLCTFLAACRGANQADITAIAHPVHVDIMSAKKLESELLQMRRQKDEFFKTSSESPLATEVRVAFKGLEYYPINWKYRFEGPVRRYPNPPRFRMIFTTGESREAIKYGYIQFQVENQNFKLEVYRLFGTKQKDLLFIPFTDSMVGKETYPAGRYIDLIEKPNGMYVIDFNNSYNPYCAYGRNYACPVTPKENRLSIPIPAGEKILSIAPKTPQDEVTKVTK